MPSRDSMRVAPGSVASTDTATGFTAFALRVYVGGGTGTGAQPDRSASAGDSIDSAISAAAATAGTTTGSGSDSSSKWAERLAAGCAVPAADPRACKSVRLVTRSDTATRRNHATSASRAATTPGMLHQGRTDKAASGETTSRSDSEANSERPRTRRADTPARKWKTRVGRTAASLTAAAGAVGASGRTE